MMKRQTGKADQSQMVRAPGAFLFAGNDFGKKFWKRFLPTGPHTGLLGSLVLILFGAFFLSAPALAGEWRFVPKIGLWVGYDDNVFFSREEIISSSVVSIWPSFELDYTTPLSSLRLTADWAILQYLEKSDLNRVNQYYDLVGDHRFAQRWDVRGGLGYINDLTLNTYLEETGRVVDRFQREYASATAGISYDMTTVSSIDTDYIYEKVKYERDIFTDFDRHRLNVRYRHRLKNQRDTLLVGPSFYHRTDDVNDTDYVSLDFGWDRDWSEITTTQALIGARYTTVENNLGNDRDVWGARGLFNLTHQGVVSVVNFRYFHDLRTTVVGTDVNVDNFFLGYTYRLTERLGLGINGRLIFSYNLFRDEDDTQDNRFYSIEPFTAYQITPKLNTSLRYRYQNSSRDVFGNDNVRERNLFWIEFNYTFPAML